ncbi:60S ribosomal protein L5 [Balamuthia mandrillaris]
MGFVKVVKNKAYFKRYQVKYRRRREGKTDYRARRKLIIQAKNKYNTPKYRLVVRFTNKDVICQIVMAKLSGDVVLTAAYSHELKRYGLPCGLTNYSSAYATGLLLARRHLTKLGLAAKYEGKTEVTGEDWNYNREELGDGPKPFRALLDVGLAKTSTGSRIFAALKGAIDGGIDVPHSEKRFAGYSAEGKSLNAEVLRKYLLGGHVAEYMRSLQDSDPEKYQKQFSQYVAAKIGPDDVEALYKKVHAAIRADPSQKKSEKAKPTGPVKRWGQKKRSLAQRRARIAQKREALIRAAQ